jgi:hypothetical protein
MAKSSMAGHTIKRNGRTIGTFGRRKLPHCLSIVPLGFGRLVSRFIFKIYIKIAKRQQAKYPNGRDTLFPLSTYFVAFERPDRLRVVGKDANKFEAKYSKTIIKNIIAGTNYQITEAGDEALILVSSTGSLILLQLHPNSADFSDSACELGTTFDQIKDGISVLKQQDGSSFVVIAHSDGLLTRRKISNVASGG